MQDYLKNYWYYLKKKYTKSGKDLMEWCIRANSGHNKWLLSQLEISFLSVAKELDPLYEGCDTWSVCFFFPLFFCFSFNCVARKAEAWVCEVSSSFLILISLPQYLVKGFLTLCNQNKCALNVIWFQDC